MDEAKLAELRMQFPVLEQVAYLNTGTCGPLPKVCVEAMEAENARQLTRGRASIPDYKRYLMWLDEVRERIGGLIGASRDEIALTHHTTEGVNIVLWGLDWQPGDAIITSTHEHPALLAPLAALHRRFGVEVLYLPFDGDPERDVALLEEACLSARVRLLAISHVSYIDGFVFPVARLAAACRARGIALLLDGAQAVGAIPVDVKALGADFYAAPGQKWLCGPEGTGFLYVNKRWISRVHPVFSGIFGVEKLSWCAQESPYMVPATGAQRFHVGGLHRQAIYGFDASLRWLQEQGFDILLQQAHQTTQYARKVLEDVEGIEVVTPARCGATLLSFRVAGLAPAMVSAKLEAAGILARDIPVAQPLVRISCGFFNTIEEIDRLAEVLKGMLSR